MLIAATQISTAFRIGTLLLALLLPAPLFAAGFTCAPPQSNSAAAAERKLDKLEEVVINGSKSTNSKKDLSAWLSRLKGQYRYEGHVDLCGRGNVADQRPVTGQADCLFLEDMRGVHCAVNVRWPEARGENGAPVLGGVSSLAPALAVYGVEPELPGIQFMLLDNKGMATHAKGKLVGDTLTTRESCIGVPGACEKITRITARPDSDDVVMLIDVEIDSQRVLRHAFLMHRVSNFMLKSPKGLIWEPEP